MFGNNRYPNLFLVQILATSLLPFSIKLEDLYQIGY
jgi:hypothetical protein